MPSANPASKKKKGRARRVGGALASISGGTISFTDRPTWRRFPAEFLARTPQERKEIACIGRASDRGGHYPITPSLSRGRQKLNPTRNFAWKRSKFTRSKELEEPTARPQT